MKRAAAAVAIALVLLGLAARPANAHAELESTAPTADSVLDDAPTTVELTFTEAVEAGLGGIRVIGPGGDGAAAGDVESSAGGTVLTTRVDAHDAGTYTVAWSVTSEDGHLISGSFLFSVERTSTPADVAVDGRAAVRFTAAVARAVAFGGTMLLLGVVAFAVAVLRRPEGSSGLHRLALAGATAVALGSAVTLVAHVAISSERSVLDALALLDDAVRDTRFGLLAFVRILFALSALGLAWLWRLHPHRLQLAALAIPTVALAVLPAITGHAWTTTPVALAVGVDVMHVLAVGAWAGGLVALLAHRRDEGANDLALRFSNVALIAMGIAVVTGLVTSFLQVRSLDGFDTAYGRLLIVKVVLVATVIGIASLTRTIVRSKDAQWTVARAVSAELVVVVVIVGVTSLLVNQPPARSAVVADTGDQIVELDGGVVNSALVQVIPGRVGNNVVHLYFLDETGIPTPADAVELTIGSADIPPRRVDITPVTPDHVSAYEVAIPSRGTWTLTITAVRTGETSTGTLTMEIR